MVVEPNNIRVSLMICDWAESLNGKLYVHGGGWTRIIAGAPVPMAIAGLIHVPYSHTNEARSVTVRVLTEDGEGFPEGNNIEFTLPFEVGRPPGMKKGEESALAFAVRIPQIIFNPGGYQVEAQIDGEDSACASEPFTAVESL
jgi:hypothetical protein